MGNQTATQSPLRDEREAAAYLKLAVGTLRRWRWAGQGPRFIKIGSRVRYDIRELDRFIDHQMCSVQICPCRIDFSRLACAEILAMGRSTSINLLG